LAIGDDGELKGKKFPDRVGDEKERDGGRPWMRSAKIKKDIGCAGVEIRMLIDIRAKGRTYLLIVHSRSLMNQVCSCHDCS
jgi:hypothetical protein